MSLTVSIPDVNIVRGNDREVRASASSCAAGWFEVDPKDARNWNHILLSTDTSLYQFPFWNEPYRPLWLTPLYLAWGTPDRAQAFVSILTVGFGSAKIGLVFRGPACIQSRCALCHEAIAQLVTWARENGYIFIRFTHSDPQVLAQLSASGHTEPFDAFPFFLDYPVLSPDYVVQQFESDEHTLAGFDREVRRKLRRANEEEYEWRVDDSPEALAEAWPLYKDCARRKHFRLERPLSVYQETMRLAREHHCVRIYSLHLKGEMVGSTVVFRDRTMAHCLLAAFAPGHRHAAILLHWRAMRDMYTLGAQQYNLGPAPGSLARFKQQFCQSPKVYPPAVTLVLNDFLFRVWRKAIFPIAKSLRPTLRKIVSHVKS